MHDTLARLGFAAIGLSTFSGCASMSDAVGTTTGPVTFAASEFSAHQDGRTYGGVQMPTATMRGVLGSSDGCLVDRASGSLIVLSGTMEFHQPDDHSPEQHIYSKSIVGDDAPETIAIGERFEVQGTRTDALPAGFELNEDIPQACESRSFFITTSQTFRSEVRRSAVDRTPHVSPVATFKVPPLPADAVRGSFTAAIEGRIVISEGCLVIDTGENYVQPIFPSDAVSWNASAQTLEFRGESYRVGDTISLGGGYSMRSELSELDSLTSPPCKTDTVFGVGVI